MTDALAPAAALAAQDGQDGNRRRSRLPCGPPRPARRGDRVAPAHGAGGGDAPRAPAGPGDRGGLRVSEGAGGRAVGDRQTVGALHQRQRFPGRLLLHVPAAYGGHPPRRGGRGTSQPSRRTAALSVLHRSARSAGRRRAALRSRRRKFRGRGQRAPGASRRRRQGSRLAAPDIAVLDSATASRRRSTPRTRTASRSR